MKKKVLGIVLVIALSIGVLTGCGVSSNAISWGTDTYTYNGHDYLVFTCDGGGIFVIEVEE